MMLLARIWIVPFIVAQCLVSALPGPGVPVNCTTGPQELQVEYDIKYYSGRVECGNLMIKTDVAQKPSVRFAAARDDHQYTLIYLALDEGTNVSWPMSPVEGNWHIHWMVANLTAGVLKGDGNTTHGSDLVGYWPKRCPEKPGLARRYGFFLMEHSGPTPPMHSVTYNPNCFDISVKHTTPECSAEQLKTWLRKYPWSMVGQNYLLEFCATDEYRQSPPAPPRPPRPPPTPRIAKSVTPVSIQEKTGPHGSFAALLCSSAKQGFCQMNAHILILVSTASLQNQLVVGGEYELDDSGVYVPLEVDYEYMMANSTGNGVGPTRQYKGMILANVPAAKTPTKLCARMWAKDTVTGHGMELDRLCHTVTWMNIQVPQNSPQGLVGRSNHVSVTYTCADADSCTFNAHWIISTYADDPTNWLYGGAEISLDGSKSWIKQGVRVIFQAKPTIDYDGKVNPKLVGPRVQFAVQKRMKRDDLPTKVCWRGWIADEEASVDSPVTENDPGTPPPEAATDGVWCMAPQMVLDEPKKCSARQITGTRRVRRNILNLTKDEFQRLADAMWIMKNTSDEEGQKKYGENFHSFDWYVVKHAVANMDSRQDQAHHNDAFPTFHAIYCLEFELTLLAIDPRIGALPYWDSSSGNVFTNDMFGSLSGTGPDGAVVDGKFANWPVASNFSMKDWAKYLHEVDGAYNNFTGYNGFMRGNFPANVQTSPYVTRYGRGYKFQHFDVCSNVRGPWPDWFSCFETGKIGKAANMTPTSLPDGPFHPGAHWGVGGTKAGCIDPGCWKDGDPMGDFWDPATSPNDPLFIFHHVNIDRSKFQFNKVNMEKRKDWYGYPLKSTSCLWPNPCAQTGTGLHDIVSGLWPFRGSLIGLDKESLTHADVACNLDVFSANYTYDTHDEGIFI